MLWIASGSAQFGLLQRGHELCKVRFGGLVLLSYVPDLQFGSMPCEFKSLLVISVFRRCIGYVSVPQAKEAQHAEKTPA